MIKNEKIVRVLCKWFKPNDATKVQLGDVVVLGGCYAIVLIAVASIIVAAGYSIGSVVCGIVSDIPFHRTHLLTVYTDVEILLHGIGAIIGLIIMAYVGEMLFKIEIAECPLQNGEDDQEGTE